MMGTLVGLTGAALLAMRWPLAVVLSFAILSCSVPRRVNAHSSTNPSPPPARFDANAALAAIADPAACAARVGYDGQFENCEGQVVAAGAALLVRVVTECGQDSCSVSAWLWRAGGIVKLLHYDGGGIAVDPALGFYVVDTRQFDDEDDMMAGFYTRAPVLHRVSLEGGDPKPFAPCMSPSLTPDAAHFACRNRHGDVLQANLSDGSLQLIAINDNPEAEQWSPYAYLYPGNVAFTSTATPGGKPGKAEATAHFGARETTFEWPPASAITELSKQSGRLLPLVTGNDNGPAGCENTLRFDVTALPTGQPAHTAALSPLRH
jgi:hypothetical protein